jgi:hypothetical protein
MTEVHQATGSLVGWGLLQPVRLPERWFNRPLAELSCIAAQPENLRPAVLARSTDRPIPAGYIL